MEGGSPLPKIIENPKQLILDEAKKILYSEGYSKLSMRNISKACGIALGTIYNYYPTKHDLVIGMMSDYWNENMNKLERLEGLDCSFYEKLDKLFAELSGFIRTFKDEWLNPGFYDQPDYVRRGTKEEILYVDKLACLIEGIIDKELKAGRIKSRVPSREAARFIMMNFVTIIQMPAFEYPAFKKILKEIIF
ncbi:MAG: bacterial regulatory s, tetR family protein [Firmicutes bacterium]|nr:bacterial regulatory s, tetR family protein [Bacillota bacterium]